MSHLSVGLAALSIAALLVGAILGLVSRLILRDRSRISASGSVLAGIVGAAIGGLAAQLLTRNAPEPRIGVVMLLSVGGTIAVLLIAQRLVHRPTPTTHELIAAGESNCVEFKSTARHNLRSGQRDDRVEAAVGKTVAGLLNAEGGTLLIGVDDGGLVIGLSHDMPYMKQATVDQYELWIHDYLTRVLGAPAVALLRVTFPVVDGQQLCRIDAAASPRPVFMLAAKSDPVRFYARLGNSTRDLSVADAIDYAVQHFHRRRWWTRRSAS